MTQKQEGYLSPLDRLNLEAVNTAASPTVWLDAHRDDVVAVLKEKGLTVTCAILGLQRQTVISWLTRRKLREGVLRTREPQPRARKRRSAPGDPPAVKAERPADPARSSPNHSTNATAFWRGKAEALEMVVRLLLTEKETPQ